MFALFTAYAIVCVKNEIYVGFGICNRQNGKSESVQKDIQCLQCENPAKPGLLNRGRLKKTNPKHLVEVLPLFPHPMS